MRGGETVERKNGSKLEGPTRAVPPAVVSIMACPFVAILLFLLPLGQLVDSAVAGSQDSLLARAQDVHTDPDLRSAILLELSRRGQTIPYPMLAPIERRVRQVGVAPYVRCLALAGKEAEEDLHRFSKHRDPAVQAEAIYALVHGKSSGATARARVVLADSRQPVEARIAAMRALGEIRSPFARVEALRLLPQLPGPIAVEAVRVVEALGSLSDVSFLIDALAKQSGRGQNEVLGLLQAWTGYRMGKDPKPWRYWERRHRAQGTPFLAPSSHVAQANQKEDTLAYLGIPILSDRIVFVIDFSGSMNSAIPSGRVTTGDSLVGGATRSQRAVSELVNLLPRLPATSKFSIVTFESGTQSFSPRLISHSVDSVARATLWLQSQSVGGGTNLFGGLQSGFDFEGAEEIVLLSDGAPTVGGVTRMSDIILRVGLWNRWRNLRLSTIGLSPGKRLGAELVRLARENGGDSQMIEGKRR